MGKKKEKGNKVFGSKLESTKAVVPEHLEQWLTELEKKGGIETEGLFRVSGSVALIKKIKEAIEEGDKINYNEYTVHDVAGITKMYLRELQEPLFTYDLYTCFTAAGASGDQSEIKQALALLPIGNRTVLHRLLSFLFKVVQVSNINKMVPENLATCLVPNLLRPKIETMEITIGDYPFLIAVFTNLIENYEHYFKTDIAEERKKRDAIKERALNYKLMMEKKYANNSSKETTKENTSLPSFTNESETHRGLVREETQSDLNFKNTMTAKYKKINSNTLTKLGSKRESTTAMEYKALLENQFQKIQSGDVSIQEIRDLLELEPGAELPRRSTPPNYSPPKPPVPTRKPQAIHNTIPSPGFRYSLDVDTEMSNLDLNNNNTNNNNNNSSNNNNMDGTRNRSWTSFEANPSDIEELLKTLPTIPSQFNLNDKIGSNSPKAPPRPPRSSTPTLK